MNKKQSIQRRSFLKRVSNIGTVGALATMGGPVSALAKPAPNTRVGSWQRVTADGLSPFLGGSFRIHGESYASVAAELVEVTRIRSKGSRPGYLPRQEAFAAVFKANSSSVLEQKTYRIEHHKLGKFDLFLSPIAMEDNKVRMEAIFN